MSGAARCDGRVTFDTSTHVSALTGRGPLERLFVLAEQEFRLQVSKSILDEVTKVLIGDFHWPNEQARKGTKFIFNISQFVIPHVQLSIVKEILATITS